MGGTKKKKKPAPNSARGFATTSIASKPGPEASSDLLAPATNDEHAENATSSSCENNFNSTKTSTQLSKTNQTDQAPPLSPEKFEKQLEEAELQLLVERHAQKVKRDAQRQISRLETDRRLLRSQADVLNFPKWISRELEEQINELIKSEARFVASRSASNTYSTRQPPSEEELIIRLWPLRQVLEATGFDSCRVEATLNHLLEIASSVQKPTKDSIWGLEDALEWLARECTIEELPSYESRLKPPLKEAFSNSSSTSRNQSPQPLEHESDSLQVAKPSSTESRPSEKVKSKLAVTCDEEIQPENLIPEYVATRKHLLELARVQVRMTRQVTVNDEQGSFAIETAKLEAKLNKILSDVLFDKYIADQIWNQERIILDRQFKAASRICGMPQSHENRADTQASPSPPTEEISNTADVTAQADIIANEVLADESDGLEDLATLFTSLPQSEIDAKTGKAETVLHLPGEDKLHIRDFGSWQGLSPKQVFEEACRSRDPLVKIKYMKIPGAGFTNRQLLSIKWNRHQSLLLHPLQSDIEISAEGLQMSFTMRQIATPKATQAEALISTFALFQLCSCNAKEEKVHLRLPPVWRDFWLELADARKEQLNSQDRGIVFSLRELVRRRQNQELEYGVILPSAFRGRGNTKINASLTSSQNEDIVRNRPVSSSAEDIKQVWYKRASSSKFQSMLVSRMRLPIWQFKTRILGAVDQNQIVIICGETGCGKSTQVPAFLLESQLLQGNLCKIYCTEPRRISAISLARRVSEELGEAKGELGTNRSLVGYSIRLEASVSRETRLVFATTGIVMRMLESSNELTDTTHLVLDEVHERSIESDFLLIVLKRLLLQRKDLKVILMSATVDAERFSRYLGGAPVLIIPGRTFPVEVRYLEDAIELTDYNTTNSPTESLVDIDEQTELETPGPKTDMMKSLASYCPKTRGTVLTMNEYQIEFDLIVQTVAHISSSETLKQFSKAILIFLPGIAEIRTLNDMFLGDPRFLKDWLVCTLHSTIATEDQESAFLVPPNGVRKIVLATNIAETGITIPDVTCVIDTGKHREMRFDERRQLSRLIDTFISRANAKQRRGRAGRVQNGLCFHLFTRYRHDCLMSEQQTPEMLRLSLQDLAIRVKICKIGQIDETLRSALDPPSAKNVRRAIDALVDVRALTPAEDLTPLGHQLARLPLDVFLGKLILLGTVFKFLDVALTLAAILSSKSPFSAPFGQRAQADKARMGFLRGNSDLLTVYNAYQAWKRVCRASSGMSKEYHFCRKNYLNQQTLANIEDLKGQLLVSLVDSGFLLLTEEERRALRGQRFSMSGRSRRQQPFFEVPQRVDVNSDNDLVSTSVIAWSFYPKLLVRDAPGTRGLRNVSNNQSISLHPTSVNRGRQDIKWLSYYHIMQSKSVYHAHETTAAEPFAIALLCGEVRFDMFAGVITLDGNRGRFALPDWKSLLFVKVLRTRLRELLSQAFRLPNKPPTAHLQKWFDIWQRISSLDEEQKRGCTVAVGAM